MEIDAYELQDLLNNGNFIKSQYKENRLSTYILS